MSLETPILFCVFNRPDLTSRVFKAIAQQRPAKLLVACDGPRESHETDQELVHRTREICQRVDWPCDLVTFYRDRNLGCRQQMADAITWAFGLHERVIILEDDCLPNPSFFSFCETLLERFAEEDRIMMISGDNFLPSASQDSSYYLSAYAHIWGWASWRRAWQHYDLAMPSWSHTRSSDILREYCSDAQEIQYWMDIFDRQQAGQLETWDYSWAYACWEQRGWAVLPQFNLISNIGFRADGTHTTDAEHQLADRPTQSIRQLVHPAILARDAVADAWTWQNVFCPTKRVAAGGKSGSARDRIRKQFWQRAA